MKKEELENCPEWLLKAKTINENVVWKNEQIVWESGIWIYGTWKGGTWKGGTWEGGIWECGTWEGGIWECGTWEGGIWRDGIWRDGVWEEGTWKEGVWEEGTWEGGTWKDGSWEEGTWKDGVWKDGIWKSGTWKGKESRLLYMCSLAGIYYDFKTKVFIGYRTTLKDGKGRWNNEFIQMEGEYFEKNIPQDGGTCIQGIHITSAAKAWTYFGINESCQFWKVEVKEKDLLDCDGEKARIRGGIFTKIERPF